MTTVDFTSRPDMPIGVGAVLLGGLEDGVDAAA